MTAHHDNEKDDAPIIPRPYLTSRRMLLKTVGATVLGTVATTLPFPSITTPVAAAPAPVVDTALQIATAAPMFQEALTELRTRGYSFVVSTQAVRHLSTYGVLTGLVLRHDDAASPRTGAEMVLTVDLVGGSLLSVQMVVGMCLVDMFLISSTRFDARLALYEELRSERMQYDEPPLLIRPRQEQQWSHPQPDARPLRPDEFVESGWPPESPSDCYWHYQGCETTAWIADDEALIYRCTEVAEEKSCQPDQRITVELTDSSSIY